MYNMSKELISSNKEELESSSANNPKGPASANTIFVPQPQACKVIYGAYGKLH